MTTDHEIGEFGEDGALDERDALILWLVQRIQSSLSHPGFCGVDISGVRVAMLATIIGKHGGGHLSSASMFNRGPSDWTSPSLTIRRGASRPGGKI